MNKEFSENAKLTDEDLNQVSGGSGNTDWAVIQKNIPNVRPQSKVLNDLNAAIKRKDWMNAGILRMRAVEYYNKMGINLSAELGIKP